MLHHQLLQFIGGWFYGSNAIVMYPRERIVRVPVCPSTKMEMPWKMLLFRSCCLALSEQSLSNCSSSLRFFAFIVVKRVVLRGRSEEATYGHVAAPFTPAVIATMTAASSCHFENYLAETNRCEIRFDNRIAQLFEHTHRSINGCNGQMTLESTDWYRTSHINRNVCRQWQFRNANSLSLANAAEQRSPQPRTWRCDRGISCVNRSSGSRKSSIAIQFRCVDYQWWRLLLKRPTRATPMSPLPLRSALMIFDYPIQSISNIYLVLIFVIMPLVSVP